MNRDYAARAVMSWVCDPFVLMFVFLAVGFTTMSYEHAIRMIEFVQNMMESMTMSFMKVWNIAWLLFTPFFASISSSCLHFVTHHIMFPIDVTMCYDERPTEIMWTHVESQFTMLVSVVQNACRHLITR